MTMMRVICYNIHGWRNSNGALSEHEIVTSLQNEKADVILLNEVKANLPSCVGIPSPRLVTLRHNGGKKLLLFSTGDNMVTLAKRVASLCGIGKDSHVQLTREDKGAVFSIAGDEPNLVGEDLPDQRRPDDKSGKYEVIVKSNDGIVEAVSSITALERLAKELGMEYHFFPAMDETFGNAILWRASVLGNTSTSSTRIHCSDKEEVRSIGTLIAGNLQFHITHLDHKCEDTRLRQLQQVMQHISTTKNGNFSLLCGDFNALDLSDYAQDMLERIQRERLEGAWEEPREEVTVALKTCGWIDSWKSCNPNVYNPSTCDRGTRIDFIWQSSATTSSSNIRSCEIKHGTGSDHSMVICEVMIE
jgi:endonuclease/exonuclease/phosphatase family metal-dependent hydrolase